MRIPRCSHTKRSPSVPAHRAAGAKASCNSLDQTRSCPYSDPRHAPFHAVFIVCMQDKPGARSLGLLPVSFYSKNHPVIFVLWLSSRTLTKRCSVTHFHLDIRSQLTNPLLCPSRNERYQSEKPHPKANTSESLPDQQGM